MSNKHRIGALLNTEDNRDIPLAAVARAIGVDTATHPKKNITDISMLAVEDQEDKGTCVGQSEGKSAEFQNFVETGKVVRLSKRGLYKLCKMQDGIPNEQGTYPRIAAAIKVSTGIPREALVKDDNSLPYAEYLNVEITNDFKTSASEFRSKGYSFVTTLDELKTAIDVTKVFNATLFVGDWSTLPVKPTEADGTFDGTHRIMVFGYEDVEEGGKTRTKVYFLNSWGLKWAKSKKSADKKLLEKGIGYFYWDEFAAGWYRDGIVYLDMPNEIIDYAKAQTYIFPRQLDKGMDGTDVMELQKRLAKETAKDGLPCFRYKVNGVVSYTTYFGDYTEQAVQRYQAAKGIVSSGTPKTTGYGRVGAKTLAALNSQPVTPTSTKLLDKWADAIQSFEGWFPKGTNGYPNGSKSWRNNNPGNIRFIGQKRALRDDGTGFCVFASYADGRAELIDLLVRAATGKSSIYKPDDTLLQFYEKYAPTSDGNYPASYAQAVARMIGVSINSKIKDIYAGTATAAATVAGATIPSMKNITSSATKIVLLYIVGILGLLALAAGMYSILTETFSEAAKIVLASFTGSVTFLLGYYFGYKGEQQPVTPVIESGEEPAGHLPYGGK